MKQIPISKLIPGMVTAEDVLTYDRQLLVPRNVILTENIISRLEGYSVYYVWINEEVIDELSKPMPVAFSDNSALSEPSNKERIRNSEQFLQFSQDFNQCAEHFRNSLMKSLYHNQPLFVNELLSETMQIMKQGRTSISVFDMLLNMRNIDDSVYAHSIDVALISNVLAKWLHFSEEEQQMATACGLFHDVGKFLLPSGVLRKPGKLTEEEFTIIKTHTTEGFHLLSKYENIPLHVKNAALMHHEKCDGSGYPYGLTGPEIDKYAKIVTIADIFDAMTSERVYRKAMCPFSVIKSFEDEGIQKYELKYILTFLENVANSYLNHRVTLTNGMEGDVIFINRDSYSRPVIRTTEDEIINLQEEYYQGIMNLRNQKNVSIETII
ncbi:MAG: HD-GYP domain-containing protein [Lachnospiraceae bacterium]|nr:HD-GYP domain-containing protein [Lachnospiraceae bacterium]